MKDLAGEHPTLAAELMTIMASGNALDEQDRKTDAQALYQQAWDALPEPKLEWVPLSSWVTGSLFNLHFDQGDFQTARQWAQRMLESRESDIDTGPWVNMGMACLELGQRAEAYRYFEDAHRVGKARAFQDRPKKYLDFYRDASKAGL
jgi:tetratricopeptide (TPR) repeat protein